MLDAEALYSLLFSQLTAAYGDALGRLDGGVALVGIRSGGAWLAERIAYDLRAQAGSSTLDVAVAVAHPTARSAAGAASGALTPLSAAASTTSAAVSNAAVGDAISTLAEADASFDAAAPDPDLAAAGAALVRAQATSPVPSIRHVLHDEDEIALGIVNVSLHRDDFASKGLHGHSAPTQLPFDIAGRRILLIDDVLYTGRTIRAAINELYDYGRPASVELAVLVDRGGRELPFSARFAAAHVDMGAGRPVVLHRGDDGRFFFESANRVD